MGGYCSATCFEHYHHRNGSAGNCSTCQHVSRLFKAHIITSYMQAGTVGYHTILTLSTAQMYAYIKQPRLKVKSFPHPIGHSEGSSHIIWCLHLESLVFLLYISTAPINNNKNHIQTNKLLILSHTMPYSFHFICGTW